MKQNSQKFLKNKKIFFVFLFFFIISNLFAEKIVFSASSMTGKTGDTSSQTYLKGNAYILTETIEIKADSIELSGEDYRYIKAEGFISGKNLESKMEFTCDSLEYDRTTKVALLLGNVDLTDTENDVKAKAQRIEYNQDKDIAVLQIEIILTQKDNICTGAYAIYHKKDQMLEISGNAQVRQGDDVFRAQNIVFNMETEDITLGGNVKGSVKDSKKKETSEGNAVVVTSEKNDSETDAENEEKNDGEAESVSSENLERDNSETVVKSEKKVNEDVAEPESKKTSSKKNKKKAKSKE